MRYSLRGERVSQQLPGPCPCPAPAYVPRLQPPSEGWIDACPQTPPNPCNSQRKEGHLFSHPPSWPSLEGSGPSPVSLPNGHSPRGQCQAPQPPGLRMLAGPVPPGRLDKLRVLHPAGALAQQVLALMLRAAVLLGGGTSAAAPGLCPQALCHPQFSPLHHPLFQPHTVLPQGWPQDHVQPPELDAIL